MQADVRQRIYESLEQKGLRKTAQRDAIIEAAFSTTEHFTADELLGMARKIEPSVSRATVYRTLPLLVSTGLLKEMDFGEDYKFYDPNYIEHPQLVAERIERFAQIVGRERVMAGTDCGFGTFAGFGPVEPDIAYLKLRSLVEGAEIASQRLWR